MTLNISKNIRFTDTLNLMPAPQSKLPKTMGFCEKVSKGFFPYRFLTLESINYCGAIHDKSHFYIPENRIEEFETFYNTFSSKLYNLKEEMLKYCQNDVYILALCFEKFNDLINEKFQVSVFDYTVGLSLVIYMKHYCVKNTIPIIGEKRKRPNSMACNLWLKYIEKTQNIVIRSASSHRIMFLDGFCESNNTAYYAYYAYMDVITMDVLNVESIENL